MAIGRPREFDPQQVLDTAVKLFWKHGYDGVSITDLTEATGINRRSLYAVFGSKEQLFRDAVQRYVDGPGGYAAIALAEPTAWDVAYALAHGAAEATSGADGPRGCLLVQSAPDELAQQRADAVAMIADRFAAAQQAGEIPDADPVLLARWISAVSQGIAVQSTSGAGRDELHAVADQALMAWPGRRP